MAEVCDTGATHYDVGELVTDHGPPARCRDIDVMSPQQDRGGRRCGISVELYAGDPRACSHGNADVEIVSAADAD